jgi:hypothetical protein
VEAAEGMGGWLAWKMQSDIDRHIEKGFEQGSQELYVPWLRVQDVPSQGRSRKVHGVKVDRLHHLLSDLEYGYLLVAEFSPEVLDIREQFPLLPVPTLQSIAHALSIRYPVYCKVSRESGAIHNKKSASSLSALYNNASHLAV